MHNLLTVLNRFNYQRKSYTYARLITGLFWLTIALLNIKRMQPTPCDTGLCRFLNCGFFTTAPVACFMAAFMLVLAALYLFERYMALTTFLMALTGTIVFTVATANGNSMHMEIVTMVLFAQGIAYTQYYFARPAFKAATPVHNLVMLYSVQIIVAGYVISGITKLNTSGLAWVAQAPDIALQVIKASSSRAIDFNMPALISNGKAIAMAILHYPLAIQVALGTTLAIELFAFTAMAGRAFCRKYSYAILTMHLFILLVMNIAIPAFIIMVIAYLLNFKVPQAPQPVPTATKYNIKSVFYSCYLGALYIALSLFIGQHHPFSTFPMFSKMDTHTRYFYLTDQNDKPFSPLTYLNLRTDEISKILTLRTGAAHTTIYNPEALRTLAQPWLAKLTNQHRQQLSNQNIQQVKLICHQLWLDKGTVLTADSLITIVAVNPK